MKKIIVFLLLFSAINLHAQQWMQGIDKQKKTKGEVSFYDIQKAFNKYWEGKDIKKKSVIKGKGYKPFKRWEAFMIPRVYPSGILPAGKTWDAIQKKKKLKVYTKAQANWTHLGPDDVPLDNYNDPSGAGRINCVAYHPTDANIIYTGSPSGGFWKSTNGGADWATTTDELASIGISDIVVHPENPSTIFVATGDGDAGDTYSIGVLKSTDGGANWESAGLDWNTNNYVRIRRLLINPDNADTLIAATNAGIYRTADGGSNWSNVQSGHYKDLEFEPGNPEVVYAARYGSSNAKTYKSTDGGVSFTEITPAALDIDDVYRLELAVTPANSSYIYALYCLSSDNGFHSLWQSTDNGANWATVTTSADINLLGWDTDGSDDGGQGWYDLTLAVSPSEADEVYVGGVNLWKTTDAGTTWNLNGHWYGGGGAPYVHADHHYLGYSPSGVLFNGNDGGLYKTSNGGTLWTDISDGLHILQIDRMGISQSNDYVSLVGNQDNGTMKGTSTSWTQIYGGDGCECIVDFTDADVVYASYIRGDIKRSTTGGSGWVTIKPSGADDGAWHTPYIMDYNDNRTLYAGYSDVYKTTDRGDNWTKISTDLTGGDNLNQMAVAPSNSDYLYVTTGTGMWKTSDGGDNWSTVDLTDIGSSYVTYIAISYSNPENIWISVSGYSDGNKVFYSSNSGTDWTNFSTGLPNVPTNCIVYQKESNDLLYVGTDIGVYYREATMTEWADYGQGLPNVVISELEIQYSAEKLRAGSRGRGLWESGIVESSANVPLVSSATTSTDGSKIEVTFTKEMKDPTGKHAEFSVNNGATIAPDAAVLKSGDAYTIVLDLPSNILFGETVTVSYTEGSVEATNDEKLASFTDKTVTNNVVEPPQFGSAATSTDGSKLEITFTKEMKDPTGKHAEFSVNNGATIAPDAATLKSGDAYTIVLDLPSNILFGETVTVSYTEGSVEATNDEKLASFTDKTVTNNVVEPPQFGSAATSTDGSEIEITFTKEMKDPVGKHAEFSANNGSTIAPDAAALKTGDASTIVLHLSSNIGHNETVNISYTKGSVESADNGILADFTDQVVTNNVPEPAGLKTIDNYKGINIYPNPNSGQFSISFDEKLKGDILVKLYNAEGKMVYSKELTKNNGSSDFKINLGDKLKGIYNIIIENNNMLYRKSILIQ